MCAYMLRAKTNDKVVLAEKKIQGEIAMAHVKGAKMHQFLEDSRELLMNRDKPVKAVFIIENLLVLMIIDKLNQAKKELYK